MHDTPKLVLERAIEAMIFSISRSCQSFTHIIFGDFPRLKPNDAKSITYDSTRGVFMRFPNV